MTDGLYRFRADIDKVVEQVHSAPAPSKVQRFVRIYEAGLPLDMTVRWFPVFALDAMEARVEELTRQGRQVWISQGLPWDPNVDKRLASIEKKTDLIKNIESVNDFRHKAVPRLRQWEEGSWTKMFYDTPLRSLTGGTIGIDTNHDNVFGIDMRALRFEAASGISDVRDLERQMSARQVLVVYSDSKIFLSIESALESMDCSVQGLSGFSKALDAVREIGPGEPRAVMLECTSSSSEGFNLLRALKESRDTARIPVVLVLGEVQYSSDVRTMVASIIRHPVSPEEMRLSIFRTGFRLLGDTTGFKLAFRDRSIQREVDGLLNMVLGVGGIYRRMMAQIANAEARPTIAFEFKLVPVAPYEFFFIDYEWSGVKNEFHRFDWLNSFGRS